jgi:hypothetical protein
MTETESEKSARLMAELEAYVEEEHASFDEVREVLTQLDKQFETLDVLGVPVRMRPTFPKKARRMMEFLVEHKDEIELLEGKTYEILAIMSKDVPWSNPKTWELLDEDYGVAFDLLEALYDGMGKKEKAIATFRKRG